MKARNKICVITGPTSGIGKAAAENFAFAGCELILAARNRHRGEKIAGELINKTGNKKIKLFTADFSSLSEITELSEKIHSDYNRIDVLINNAGAFFSNFHKTSEGIEASYVVNYLSRFLFTNQLLDLLIKSESGRIINVTGEYYRKGKLDFSVKADNNYTGMMGVSRAKFADMLFVAELSRRLNETNVKINAVHPGTVATNIINNDPDASFYLKFLYSLCRPFLRSPYKTAEDLNYLAFSDDAGKMSGKYFCCEKLRKPDPAVYDEESALKLWEFSEKLTGYRNTLFENNKLIMEQ